MDIDLVCKREVDAEQTRFFTEYDERKNFFCSAECKRAFDDHPDRYIQEQAKQEVGLE